MGNGQSVAHGTYTSTSTLVALNAFAFVVHIVSASLGTVLNRQSNPKVSAIVPLVEFVQNPAPGEDIFRSTPRTAFKIGALFQFVFFAYATAAAHLIYIAVLVYPSFDAFVKNQLERWSGLKANSRQPFRWVEYALTASVISAFGQLAIGNSSLYFFIVTITNGVTLQMFGYLLECLDARIEKDKKLAAYAWSQATLLNLVVVGIILNQVFSSKVHTTVFYWNVVRDLLHFV